VPSPGLAGESDARTMSPHGTGSASVLEARPSPAGFDPPARSAAQPRRPAGLFFSGGIAGWPHVRSRCLSARSDQQEKF